MRARTAPAPLLFLLLTLAPGCASGPREVSVGPDWAPAGGGGGPSRLQRLVESLEGPAVVRLAPGDYHLVAVDFVDDSCANCAELPERPVEATRGLLVSGRGLRLVGPEEGEAVLHSHAGYGVLFDRCEDCSLEGLTITAGQRDWEPNASNAAVVVKRSSVVIRGCTLRDNLGDEERVKRTVVGIIGVAGREGSDFVVEGCRIVRNSWDGVALYRGAKAIIRGNVIDGVDAVRGRPRASASGGRGVGIGITWDARAVVEGNLVRRYWKGIGVFVDGRAELRRNVVEDVLTWGLSLWDAGQGRPGLVAASNVVHRAGACGASLQRSEPLEEGEAGLFVGNVLVLTGLDPAYDSPTSYCRQTALDEAAVPEGFRVEGNLFHANREPDGSGAGRDAKLAAFRGALAPLLEELRTEAALEGSDFLRDWAR
jgi:hypothetical protein